MRNYNNYFGDIMSQSKSTILSKAEKMKFKRINKRDQDPPIIQIIESDDSNPPSNRHNNNLDRINKQADNSASHKSQQQQQNKQESNKIEDTANAKGYANMINFDRLKKFMPPSVPERKPIVLKTQICGDGMEMSNYQGRHLVGYKIAGSDSTKYISENHLRQRAVNVEEDLQKLEKQKQMREMENEEKEREKIISENLLFNEEGDKKQEKQQQEQQPKKKREVKIYRYFDNQSNQESIDNDLDEDDNEISKKKYQKCFRCGQKGHIAKNCHLQAKTTCMFCLGDHHHFECTDKLCFRCNQTGHVSQQCKASGKKCNRCRRVGHIERDCGTIIMLDYSSTKDAQIRDRYSQSDLKRLKCLAECRARKGHFNCFQYGSRPQKIYGGSSQKQSHYRY